MVMKLLVLCVLFAGVRAQSSNQLGANNEFETCWEYCFQAIDSTPEERFRPAYNDFYEMGMEARRLKNLRSTNGTVYLLDSTLSNWHNPAANSNLDPSETGESIWQFQKDLASITVMMLGNDENRNPATLMQFNEDRGWTCDNYGCLDCCEAVDILQTPGYLEMIEMDADSHHDGRIEPACRLGYTTLHDQCNDPSNPTPPELCREMAIVFANSDFNSNVDAHSHYDDYSPCDEHFDTRMSVGTHAVEHHELKGFASLDAKPIYIADNAYTIEASQHLVQCMTERCCSSTRAPLTRPLSCVATADHFGEVTEAYDHDIITTPPPPPPFVH